MRTGSDSASSAEGDVVRGEVNEWDSLMMVEADKSGIGVVVSSSLALDIKL